MTSEQLLAVTAAFAVANAVILLLLFVRLMTMPDAGPARIPLTRPAEGGAGMGAGNGDDGVGVGRAGSALSPIAYHRIVRIAAWSFIMATAALVAVTGLWREAEGTIALVLGGLGVFVLVVHDILPDEFLGLPGFVLEGSVAVTVATLLMMLTGREESPFFFVFPLIVAGAALVITTRATLLLLAGATAGYLVAVFLGRTASIETDSIARLAVSLAALVLLAYVAVVIAREHRTTLGAAMRLATRDPLTGLVNRSVLFSAIEREIARSTRSGRGFCLLMMDLDELKAINDQFGHFEGDRVLRQVGEVIRSGVRRIDVAARYGGDEFVALLPETDPTGGYVLAEKIRQGVAELGSTVLGRRATLSVGVVSWPRDGRTADELLVSADQAMYASKRLGRNRVMGVPAAVGGWERQSV